MLQGANSHTPKFINFGLIRDLGDFSKFYQPPILYLAFQALDKFIYELGCFPVASTG